MTRSADEVEREVEQSRSELDRNMEALKSKMTPGQLFDEAARTMGGTGQQIAGKFMEQAKENPMPLAVMGLGLAWLMTSSRKSERGAASWAEGASTGGTAGAAGLGQRAADMASSAGEGLADKAHAALDGGRSALGSAREAAGAATDRVAQVGRRAQTGVMEAIEAEPLLMAAAGLLVGLAVGAALPATPAENRTLGGIRDRVVDKTQDLARTGLRQAGEATKAAYEGVKSELQDAPEGEDPAAKAGRIAHAGIAAAQDELQKPH